MVETSIKEEKRRDFFWKETVLKKGGGDGKGRYCFKLFKPEGKRELGFDQNVKKKSMLCQTACHERLSNC